MGYRIKLVRESRKMTQEELAQKSGVARTIINGLESGRLKNTTTNTLQKIAKALDTTIAEIFFESDV